MLALYVSPVLVIIAHPNFLALSWKAILPSEVPGANGIRPSVTILALGVRPMVTNDRATPSDHLSAASGTKPLNALYRQNAFAKTVYSWEHSLVSIFKTIQQ